MSEEDWEEKYGETKKTDHFTTEADRREAMASANNRASVPPGAYHPNMRRAAVKKWTNLQEMGMTPYTPYDYSLPIDVPNANRKRVIHKHLKSFVKRAEEAGYEVKEVAKDPVTKVVYAKICMDDICTYQVIMGPRGTMSGGTRRKRRRSRGTRR